MLTRHLTRGLKTGVAGGLAFGLFVTLIGTPLVRYAESFEGGHSHGGGSAVASDAVGSITSVAGGVVFGALLGTVVFGALFYLLEPALPGTLGTKSYVLGAGGFLTVSGAPWLLFPPQPPGVEAALAIGVRLRWYLLLMVAGAFACGLSGYAYTRFRARGSRLPPVLGAVVPICLLPVVAALGPANPVSGSVPLSLTSVFRTIVGVGQMGLWFVLASVHAWLLRRDRVGDIEGGDVDDSGRSALAGTPPSVFDP
jgi:predicted cobalt transporter CbtA